MKLVKKMTIIFFVCLICTAPIFPALAATAPKLDITDVMDDLKGLKIGDKAFDPEEYPFDSTGDLSTIGLYEYGWGTPQYNLYAYIYNPRYGLDGYEYRYNDEDIKLVVKLYIDDETEIKFNYDQLSTTIIDVSTDGRFIKVRIDGSPFVSKLASSDKRTYDVSGSIYRYQKKDDGGTFKGMTFINTGSVVTFTGSSSYIRSKETIDLEVYPSMYRFPVDDYTHQMLYTAYFVIPKKYKTDYDALVGIDASWFETHTAPVVTVDDNSLYDILSQMSTDSVLDSYLSTGNFYRSYGAIISDYFVSRYDGWPDWVSGNMTINLQSLSGYVLRKELFYVDSLLGGYTLDFRFENNVATKFDHVLKVANLNSDYYIPTVGRYYDINGDGQGDILATFIDSVDDGQKYGQQKHSFTAKDFHLIDNTWSGFWERLFNKDIDLNIQPFYYLKDEDMALYSTNKINENLYIGEEYWSDFYSVYQDAKKNGDQVVLFRFAVRDYYSAPAAYIDGDEYTWSSYGECNLSYRTAFLDFDIISLAFADNNVIYSFDVNSDPIDFVPGIHDPDAPGGGGVVDDWLADLISRIDAAVKIVCLVAAAVVVLVVLDKFTGIFDRLFGRRRR